jgi:hypothetical protein
MKDERTRKKSFESIIKDLQNMKINIKENMYLFI